jgi:hypothetical protein
MSAKINAITAFKSICGIVLSPSWTPRHTNMLRKRMFQDDFVAT